MSTSTYKNRFVIVYDTICEGNQCMTEDGNPFLFGSSAEATRVLFESALGMIEAQDAEALADLEISPEQVARMREINATGDAAAMEKFLEENPQCNYNGEWVQPADEFILNRKAIFTGKGLVITGTKLK